jgi:nitrogen fixation/metabolism regulation signal transduction histidine kinase
LNNEQSDTIETDIKAQMSESLRVIQKIFNDPVNAENYTKLNSQVEYFHTICDNYRDKLLNTSAKTAMGNTEFSTTSKTNTIIILIISSLITTFIGFIVSSSISGPLKQMLKAAKNLSVGDLSQTIEVHGCPEVNEAF